MAKKKLEEILQERMENLEEILQEHIGPGYKHCEANVIQDIMGADTPEKKLELAKRYRKMCDCYGDDHDPERGHLYLDALMLRIAYDAGLKDVCRIFAACQKWYA